MLLHKNGRFYCGRASFALPDNCQVFTMEHELYAEYGFTLADTSESYTMDVCFRHEDDKPQGVLSNNVENVAHGPYELRPYEDNGISGYYATYHDKRNYYLEFVLTVDAEIGDIDDEPVNTFSLLVQSESESGIQKAEADTLIWELLKSVRVDER